MDELGKTALHLAAASHDLVEAETLLHDGADPDQRDFDDHSALAVAVKATDLEMVTLLLKSGASPDMANYFGQTPLMFAVRRGERQLLELLLGAGAKPNLVDNQNNSAFDYTDELDLWSAYGIRRRLKRAGGRRHGGKARPSRWSRAKRLFLPDAYQEFQDATHSYTGKSGVITQWLIASFLLSRLFGWSGIDVLVTVVLAIVWTVSAHNYSLLHWPVSLWNVASVWSDTVRQTGTVAERTSTTPEIYVSNLIRFGLMDLLTSAKARSNPDQRERWICALFDLGSAVLALSLIGYLSTLLLTLPQTPSFKITPTLPGALAWFAVIPLAVIVLKLQVVLAHAKLRIVQSALDKKASALAGKLDYLDLDEDAQYILYLRAFTTTSRLRLSGMDMETVIAYSVAPYLPMIALGEPGEHVGAGRVLTTEQEWRSLVLKLIDRAPMILVVPSNRAGTLWEVGQLRDRSCLNKTVFLMPPASISELPVKQDWQQARESLLSMGIDIPPHFEKGLLFSLNPDGSFRDHAPLNATPRSIAGPGPLDDDGYGQGDDQEF